jgi:hypothetical protein
MSNSIERTLNFNEKSISLVHADGQWWVAIKPLCEALDINFDRQYKNLLYDEILSQLYAKQHTTGADGKLYQMVCLPEKFIYGWLFSIRSESAILREYKVQCYNVLFDHFHGMLASRSNILRDAAETHTEIAALKEKLMESPDYKRLSELNARLPALQKRARELDNDLLANRPTLFGPQN